MRFPVIALVSILAAASTPLLADNIPDNYPGQLAADHTFSATGTSVTAYFFSSSASDDDKIILWDKTSGAMTAPSLDNHSSAVGSSVSLATKSGDTLVFIIDNLSTGMFYSSVDYNGNPSPANFNDDGYNHAYSASYSGGGGVIPAGTYLGMEDLGVASLKPLTGSDLDYNDDNFVFTNVLATTTPEPSSFLLFGTGLIGAAGVLRRKFAL